ncbi:polyketide cyclase / dehydrase and lipid transport [Antrihabitans sp. YC2-6]|uniref:polyketide cyclase / dehydrase and lipid transport n=1 Tax=Antrihabitans sp. YC2-6 TaxID=2799498 RepID=UPI0018F2B7C1|nr:polyketide cyclase / dehydrase and lipid transport [Antrihabitans sp. YC2-6]MBJ8343240.1 polyketide cyclase / dehydrase and lipid transport [Antrihabitans sp. YC2-6]
MSTIQVADQTFVAAQPVRVGAAVAAPNRWRQWWPDLSLEVREDRAEQGIRWAVSGALTGTMEVWLEPALDGVILHYFLHAEPTGAFDSRKVLELNRIRRVAGKKMSFEIKGELEAGRKPGEPVG